MADDKIVALNMGPYSIRVGRDAVTEIQRTSENGQMALVPWFLVYHGDRIHQSVNAAHVHIVEYGETTDG